MPHCTGSASTNDDVERGRGWDHSHSHSFRLCMHYLRRPMLTKGSRVSSMKLAWGSPLRTQSDSPSNPLEHEMEHLQPRCCYMLRSAPTWSFWFFVFGLWIFYWLVYVPQAFVIFVSYFWFLGTFLVSFCFFLKLLFVWVQNRAKSSTDPPKPSPAQTDDTNGRVQTKSFSNTRPTRIDLFILLKFSLF